MGQITFVEPWYYGTVYHFLFLILSWATALYYIGSNSQKLLRSEDNPMQGMALLLTLLLVIFIGLRPDSPFFVDSGSYRETYSVLVQKNAYVPIDFHSEWLWENYTVFCKTIGLNHHELFFIVSLFYFGGMLIASVLLTRNNLWMSMLFFFTAFSTYSFGVNGIRNGVACSIELLAIALIAIDKKYWPLTCVIAFLTMGIHRSTMLPSAAAIASVFIIKDPKIAIRFWLISIAVSLVAGPLVTQFFAALGFDDRLDQYTSGGQEQDSISGISAGFRWDFLFYSIWPIVLTWYLTMFRKYKDKTFNVIANTYILCNAFWVMVIRAAFSNRFAYLSWFLYPLVIAYPLFRMNLWKDQDRKTAIIFFLYSGFTLFMFFIYYFGTISGFRGFNQYWWRN